jgi:hypothetical protein
MIHLAVLYVLRAYVWLFRRPVLTIKGPDGTPYLTRWRLFGTFAGEWGRPGWYLHFFHRSDYDRDLHNHPWEWCDVTVLKGGYLEERANNREHVGADELHHFRTIIRLPGRSYTLMPMHYHRTTLLDETAGSWSLIHAGPKHGRRWGFARPNGFAYAGSNSQDGIPPVMGDT